MGQRVSTEDKQKIKVLFDRKGEEYLSLSEIGERIGEGVSKQTVWYHVRKMGLERQEPPVHQQLHAQRREKAAGLLAEEPDMTIKDLSEHLECSWDVAKSIMEELGYYEEPVPFMEKVDSERLIRLYVVEDLSLAELQEVYPDVSEMTLSKTLKELGVPMRPQGAASGDIRTEWRKEAMNQMGLAS
jgi:predicted DNA-binding protein YlxM (UPF0122 family)